MSKPERRTHKSGLLGDIFAALVIALFTICVFVVIDIVVQIFERWS